MITKRNWQFHETGFTANLLILGLLGILAVQVWLHYHPPARGETQDGSAGSRHAILAKETQADGMEPLRGGPWSPHVRRMEQALAQKNVSDAELAWHDAYATTLAGRRWEGLIAVGDAALRIGEVMGARPGRQAKARWLYLAALFQARERGSLDGVLRTAQAFAALGDREMADQAIRIATDLAVRSREAEASIRVRAFAERLEARFFEAKSAAFDPF